MVYGYPIFFPYDDIPNQGYLIGNNKRNIGNVKNKKVLILADWYVRLIKDFLSDILGLFLKSWIMYSWNVLL